MLSDKMGSVQTGGNSPLSLTSEQKCELTWRRNLQSRRKQKS